MKYFRNPMIAVTCMVLMAGVAFACPFCSAPSLTLSEQLAAAQTSALVQWTGGEKADREQGFAGTTEYEVLQIVQDESKKLKTGQKITLDRYRGGQSGDLFVLLGNVISERIDWSSPLEVTETSFNYMTQAPSKESNPTERLGYFMKFLEFSDPMIASDAYGEFANAPYKDIVPLSSRMPREKLREWLADPDVTPTRIGLYGLMLGLCGEPQDADFLKQLILEPTDDFRLGIDGVMGGYLVLTGSEGLEVINEYKLKNPDIPFSETFAAMQALRFMWTYGDGRVPAEELRGSMRLLLDRPNLADLVIVDLARWQDWSVMDRLMDLYDQEEYDVPSIKRAVVRFMLIAEKDAAKVKEGQELPEYVEKSQKYLAHLRENDPKTVTAAERYFFD